MNRKIYQNITTSTRKKGIENAMKRCLSFLMVLALMLSLMAGLAAAEPFSAEIREYLGETESVFDAPLGEPTPDAIYVPYDFDPDENNFTIDFPNKYPQPDPLAHQDVDEDFAPFSNIITINYRGNGHTHGTVPASHTHAVGSSVTLRQPGTMTRTGYTFGGWRNWDGTVFPAGFTWTPTSGATWTFDAVWNRNAVVATITINYRGNGHTHGTVPASHVVNLGNSVTLRQPGTMTRTGYTFGGWTDANRTGSWPAGFTWTPTSAGTWTFYAVWNRNNAFVQFDAWVSLSDPNGVLNVRRGPGTHYAIDGTLRHGDQVRVQGERNVSGTIWWQIGATRWVSSAFMTLTRPAANAITATPNAPAFGSHSVGYAQRPVQTVTIRNTGTQNVTLNALPAVANWTLSPGANWGTAIAPNGTRTFTLRPNNGLPAGTFNPTINITGRSGTVNVTARVNPTFTVTSAAGGAYLIRTFNNGHTNFNRVNARNYAAQWVNSRNPAFTNFDGMGGNCTNFVSQALMAGGIPFTTRVHEPNDNHWYYFSGNWGWGRTSSWTHAHYFRRHFGEVNNVGVRRSYQMRIYRPTDITTQSGGQNATTNANWDNLFNHIGAGDVVHYMRLGLGAQDPTATFHSTIVYRKTTGTVTLAQNTADGFRNLREVARTFINPAGGNIHHIVVIRMNSATTW